MGIFPGNRLMLVDAWRKFFSGWLSVLLMAFFGVGPFIWSIPAINQGCMLLRELKDLLLYSIHVYLFNILHLL